MCLFSCPVPQGCRWCGVVCVGWGRFWGLDQTGCACCLSAAPPCQLTRSGWGRCGAGGGRCRRCADPPASVNREVLTAGHWWRPDGRRQDRSAVCHQLLVLCLCVSNCCEHPHWKVKSCRHRDVIWLKYADNRSHSILFKYGRRFLKLFNCLTNSSNEVYWASEASASGNRNMLSTVVVRRSPESGQTEVKPTNQKPRDEKYVQGTRSLNQ